MGSGANWYQIGKKTCYIPKVSKFFCRKKISMLADLKVSSLACKCVFYRPKHNEKWGNSWNWLLKVLKCKKEKYQQ